MHPLKVSYCLFFGDDDVHPFKEYYHLLLLRTMNIHLRNLIIVLFLRTMYIHLRNLIAVFFVEDDVHPFKESYRRLFRRK